MVETKETRTPMYLIFHQNALCEEIIAREIQKWSFLLNFLGNQTSRNKIIKINKRTKLYLFCNSYELDSITNSQKIKFRVEKSEMRTGI